jgi:hypothetical protein
MAERASQKQLLFRGINMKLPKLLQFPWPTPYVSTFTLPHTSKQIICSILVIHSNSMGRVTTQDTNIH